MALPSHQFSILNVRSFLEIKKKKQCNSKTKNKNNKFSGKHFGKSSFLPRQEMYFL